MASPAPSVLAPKLFTITNSSSYSPTSASPGVVAASGYGEPLVRTSTRLRFVVVRNFFPEVGMRPCITRHAFVADLWSGRIARRKSRKVAGPVKAMAEETMWITASSAVALVVALAAFAALGGYLLSIGVDNEERGEEEKIEKLQEQGLYAKPEPTQYEEQGVATRTRKRRITEE